MDTRWSYNTKLVVVIVLLVLTAGFLLTFKHAIPPLLISLVLAYLLKPPVDFIVRRTGWPRGLAIIAIYLLILAVIAVMPIVFTPSLIALFSGVRIDFQSLAPLFGSLNESVITLGPTTINLGELLQQALQGLQNLVAPFATGAFQVVAGVASTIFWLVFVVVVVFWLLKDSNRLEGWLFDHIPKPYREEIAQLMRELGHIWGNFFRGEIVLALSVGSMAGISMFILGVSNALMLGVLAGLMEFIPTIGPPIATIPAVIIAYIAGSSWLPLSNFVLALIVILVYVVIFQIEQLYLLPRIMGRRVRLHPGIVFVGTIIGAVRFGVLGVLLAAPVIASVREIGNYLYCKLLDIEPYAELREREQVDIEWRGMIRGYPIAGVLFDLDGTLADTDDQAVEKIARKLGRLQRIFPNRDARPLVRHWLMVAEGPINWMITHFDRVDLDDELFRLNRWLREALGYHKPESMRLIPGVDATLRELRQSYRLALVTTRDRATAEHFLNEHGLAELFDAVVTADDVQRLKPHPEPVLTAIAQLELQPEQCVMVGDTSVDVLAGQAAGARTIAVLCGFGQRQDLEGADLVLESTTELTNWL
ncbi:MAG: AI-2E family transporter [Caldilineae bacterium]|nr:MAG: AI-2E family transporter [Caldilineae bacterium]